MSSSESEINVQNIQNINIQKKKKKKKYIDTIDIYIISLKRSSDRKIIFDNYNSQYIKKYNYFEAVDGSSLDLSKLPNNHFDKKSSGYTKGALGCAFSHLQLWEKCIENNKPMLIMEDDAIVNMEFSTHLQNVVKMLPSDWDILQLSYNYDSVLSFNNTVYEQCHGIFNKHKMTKIDINNFINSKIYPTIAKLNHSFGTSAYLISPKGAKIFKEKCFPLNNTIITIPFLNSIKCFTIDCMMNSIYKNTSSYVCIIPFIITPHICDDYKSTIS